MMSDATVFLAAAPQRSGAIARVGVDRACWIGSVAIAAVLFGLLANQHWVPGGDSEVYVATARNLVLHHFSLAHGYLFNGQPINMFPPGWPYVLAVAMSISTRFAFLKFILLMSMIGTLAVAYPICRRFAPPMISAGAVVMSALVSHVFPLTFWLHSDALFCVISAASFLIALQIGEGRASTWRIIILCLLCVAANTVRYAGPFNWLVIAAALMQKQQLSLRTMFRNAETRRLIIVVLTTFVLSIGTFVGWRTALHVNEQQIAAMREAGGTEDTGIDVHADATTRHEYSLLNGDETGIKGMLMRPVIAGNWYSFLYWQPFRFGVVNLLNLVSLLFGWIVMLPLFVLAYDELKHGRFFWAGVALYGFSLALLWPHPNARYLVPIVYLLLLGLWLGAKRVGELWPAMAMWMNGGLIAFVMGFLLCNGTLYGIEVWAQRSSNFYGTYEAGLNKDLIAASNWIVAHHLPSSEGIAVSERYVNLSKNAKTSKLGLRVTTMLTGRPIMSLPKRYLKNRATTGPSGGLLSGPLASASASTVPDYLFDPDPANNEFFMLWARQVGVKYFLYQPPVSPWRALHFRVPWLQEHATHQKVINTDAGWRLYKVPTTGPSAERIGTLPETGDWPLRVPGL